MCIRDSPRARQMLGLNEASDLGLATCSPELAQGFFDWCRGLGEAAVLTRVPASGFELRASFIPVSYTHLDVYKRQPLISKQTGN